MKTPDVPEWLSHVAATSYLNTRDVAKIFGFSSAKCLSTSMRKGCFPKPDTHIRSEFTSSKQKFRAMWLAKTIVTEINRRKALKGSVRACTPV